MDIQFRPLVKWPRKLTPAAERRNSQFKADLSATLDLLRHELGMVAAASPVVQVAVYETQFSKKTGMPFAEAEPQHPGVVLAFKREGMPMSFPCDAFTDWRDNLRAVALALEALRKVDRYGVTSGNEQYLGFRALPPPGPSHESIATVEDAAALLETAADRGGLMTLAAAIIKDPIAYKQAYKVAASALHPDSEKAKADPASAAANWALLQAAKTLLDDHHKAG